MLFGQKRMYPENNSGRECCWPYLIGQHPLSPVFGQKRPGTPGNSYFAQLPPVFGHFMFLSGGLLDMGLFKPALNNKQQNFAQVTWRLTKFYHLNNVGSNQFLYPCLTGGYWVEAVTKGGRRFMTAWRQEEEDAARHRQEKREATRLGKLQSHTEA